MSDGNGVKTLLILRHGKARPDDPEHDFARGLKKRGARQAEQAGQEISRQGIRLDVVVSSAARRARQTAKRAARTAGYAGSIVKLDSLYLSGPARHLEVLAGLDDACRAVLLVGHNPDLEDLVSRLSGRLLPLPTGALVGIDLDTPSWNTLTSTPGRLRFVFVPGRSP